MNFVQSFIASLIVALLTFSVTRPDVPVVVDPNNPVVVPVDPSTKATAATYVYEKDETAISFGVAAGLNRLNREKKIVATLFEADTVDGDGDVPDQYRVPLVEAQKVGLPALVVTAGPDVLNVVKAPATEEAVWGAVR